MAVSTAVFSDPDIGDTTFSVGGSTQRSARTRFADQFNIKDHGAGAVGATDDSAIFSAAFTSVEASGGRLFVPAGSYPITSNIIPAAGDVAFFADPKATFSGGGLFRFGNLIPYIPQPVYSPDLYSKTYGSEWNGHKNVFQRASYIKANVARGGGSVGPAFVALFGHGEAAVASSAAWGINIVGFATADTAVSISNETDSGAMTSGAKAYNTLLAAVGLFPTQNYLQMQANVATATAANGIYFNNRQATAINPAGDPVTTDIPAVSGSLIIADTGTAQRGINFATMTFSTSEWESKSFVVGPSPSAADWNFIRVDSSTTGDPKLTAKATNGAATNFDFYTTGTGAHQFLTGSTSAIQFKVKDTAGATDRVEVTGGSGDVSITSSGSSTNSSVAISGKGSGGGKMRDGGAALKFQWNTTGIGFFAAAPIAKPTISGSRTDGSALASLLTNLASYGLVTDSSTA